MTDRNQDFEDVPPELVAELKAADKPVAMITSRVDREISALAKRQFARRSPIRRVALFATAASVLLAIFLLRSGDPALDSEHDGLADLDASGQVDIADVLYLARRNKDQAAIDAFALRIVSLDSDGDAS